MYAFYISLEKMPQFFIFYFGCNFSLHVPISHTSSQLSLFPLQKGPKVLAGFTRSGPHIGLFLCHPLSSNHLSHTWHKRADPLCHIITIFLLLIFFSLHDACRHQPSFLRVLG
jgi:hypothetical protein